MAGTLEGGRKAAITNKSKHGLAWYAEIGAIGGRNGHTGGFASNPELARIAGAKGGRNSKRGRATHYIRYSVYDADEKLIVRYKYEAQAINRVKAVDRSGGAAFYRKELVSAEDLGADNA